MMGYGRGDEALVRYALHEYADQEFLDAFERLMGDRQRLIEMVMDARQSIQEIADEVHDVRDKGRHEAR